MSSSAFYGSEDSWEKMKSMYQLAAGHIHQHAGLALSFFYILKRGFCHSWMLCFHLSQSAATNAVNETIVNKSGGNT